MSKNYHYLTRIAQVDAIKLDNEIVDVLKKQIYEVTRYLPGDFVIKYDPEFTLLLRLFIFNYSLVTNRATLGQQLLAIKYKNLSNKKLFLYGLLTAGLHYFKSRLHSLKSDAISNINLTKLIDRIEGLILLISCLNFLNFLRSGEKPLLIDRILNLKQISLIKRYQANHLHSYLSREILWHTFIELLLNILPLINYHVLKRKLNSLCNWNQDHINQKTANRSFTLVTRCPHCNEKPVLPYHMGCSHLFCYYCLMGNFEADKEYQCPACNFAGKEIIKFYM